MSWKNRGPGQPCRPCSSTVFSTGFFQILHILALIRNFPTENNGQNLVFKIRVCRKIFLTKKKIDRLVSLINLLHAKYAAVIGQFFSRRWEIRTISLVNPLVSISRLKYIFFNLLKKNIKKKQKNVEMCFEVEKFWTMWVWSNVSTAWKKFPQKTGKS